MCYKHRSIERTEPFQCTTHVDKNWNVNMHYVHGIGPQKSVFMVAKALLRNILRKKKFHSVN